MLYVGGRVDNNTAENENDRHKRNESIYKSDERKLYTVAKHYDCGLDMRRIIFEHFELRFDAGRIAEQID